MADDLGSKSASGVRREKAALSSVAATPAGSNRSRRGGDEMSEASGYRLAFRTLCVAPFEDLERSGALAVSGTLV